VSKKSGGCQYSLCRGCLLPNRMATMQKWSTPLSCVNDSQGAFSSVNPASIHSLYSDQKTRALLSGKWDRRG
jgi:hypothetical protein